MSDGKGAIVASVVAIGGITAINEVAKGRAPKIKTFMALAVLFVILSIMADFNADLAKALAVLILIGTLLAQGSAVAAFLGRKG